MSKSTYNLAGYGGALAVTGVLQAGVVSPVICLGAACTSSASAASACF